MKRAIYYTIAAKTYSFDYVVLAVTSVKRTMIYGRDQYDIPTHKHVHNCHGKFDKREDAEAVVNDIHNLTKKYYDLRRPVNDHLNHLYAVERQEINELLNKAGSR